MVRRADPHLRRDRAKFPDLGVRDHAARTEIGEVAELGILDLGIAEHLAADADRRLAQFDGGLDNGFSKLRTHSGIPNQAARTSERNRLTWPARSLDCDDNCSAAPSTWLAAEPVSSAARCTPEMLELTSWVPRAASWTLREISLVADPCSSIAAAIAMPIWSISAITLATFWIAVTVSSLAAWMAAICSDISVVALAVWPASDLTSEAMTAKPRPASPARAASMVALRASRLVWAAMLWISVTTSPIFCAPSAKERAVSPVRRAFSTARAAISVDCAT